jgi:hypothetical protein
MDDEHVGVKKVVSLFPILREEIECLSDANRQELETKVLEFATLCVLEGKLRKLTLTISGYDHDPRELFEIPEVCAWAKDAYRFLPGLWFFLDDAARDRFVGWLCGPFTRKEIEKSDFLQRLDEKMTECMEYSVAASADILEKAGATKEMISAFYVQEMRDHAGKKGKFS